MKKILGILAVALFILLINASCKTKAHCDAYNGMTDSKESSQTDR